MNQPAEVDREQYWICLSCLQINHRSVHSCRACSSHQPAFAELLTLEEARDQADIIRVDALLARAKESLQSTKKAEKKQAKGNPAGAVDASEKTVPAKHRQAKAQRGPEEPGLASEAEKTRPTGGNTTAPFQASDHRPEPQVSQPQSADAEPAELIPATPWWPNAAALIQGSELSAVFQKAHSDGRRFPAVASWIPSNAEKTRERKSISRPKNWYYAVGVIATILLIVAVIQWMFTPHYKLVQVQGIFWSVDIPIERAVTVSIKEDGSKGSVSSTGSEITKWVLMRTLHEEGNTQEVRTPEVVLPDERFRAGEPTWVFRVDLVDPQGFVYAEYFPQERWMLFSPGQSYRATLKNGSIVQLEPLP